MPSIYAALLFLHILSAAYWVGGMALMHFAVRPSAVATLEPPQRLPFLAATLERFFVGVSTAIALLLATGLGMVWLAGGFANVRWNVHAMLALGLVMMAIYLHIRFAPFPRLRNAVAARTWPVAASNLNTIRKLVELNLVLGVIVFALAVMGRAI
ncbi:CopD family protein [Variovorax sp. Sphag1AA]|uniref:CopD family protein n=1 Tax=Variovorax sp. Sphag1AA TaxID=2587027 RepID=UPI0016192B7A|nr:CopD family protein [Variovorax sp. Sphag1AA]MBB3180259.1 putative membrane protein [Variovorax sp. Sphag1AA]